MWRGRSENSALCRFSIDLVPTRPLSLPRYPTTPVHTLSLHWYSGTRASRTATTSTPTWPGPQGELQVTGHCGTLYNFEQLFSSISKLLVQARKRSMHEPNIGGAVPANPIQRLLCWILVARVCLSVSTYSAAPNGIPKPKFFGNCNPCLFVTFCGLKTFQPANRRQRDQIVTKMWSPPPLERFWRLGS